MNNFEKTDIIISKLKEGKNIQTIKNETGFSYKKISRVKNNFKNEDKGLDELNDDITEIKKYEIRGNKYILKHKTLKKEYPIDIKTIDNIFKDYSKHGNNLSGEAILIKYKLKPEVFQLIKSKLRLYKASDVISPYTFENSTEEEIEYKIEEAIDESLNNHKIKFIDTYDKKFRKMANEAIRFKGNYEYRLEQLNKVINNFKLVGPKYGSLKIKENNDNRIAFVTGDWHIGKEGTKDVLKRIGYLKEHILDVKEKFITINFTGDILESLVDDGMHSGQIKNGDGPFGYAGFTMALNIVIDIIECASKQGKQIKFISIPDNHVRTSKSHKEDPDRFGHMTFNRMLELYFRFNKKVEIIYSEEKWIHHNVNGVLNIMHHGDEGIASKKASEIIATIDREKLTKHILVIYGHLHTVKIENPHKGITQIITPALAGPGRYSEKNKWTSYTGYITIKINKFGIPCPTINYLD